MTRFILVLVLLTGAFVVHAAQGQGFKTAGELLQLLKLCESTEKEGSVIGAAGCAARQR